MSAMVDSRPAASSATPGPARRCRAAFEYAIEGDARFISHRDEMRVLARALRRADWPVAYSRGFNPQPRLSIPLPRYVGLGCSCQLAITDLSGPCEAEWLRGRLAGVFPPGLQLSALYAPATLRAPHPLRVEFQLILDPPQLDGLPARVEVLLATGAAPRVERRGDDPLPLAALRSFVSMLELVRERLTFTLSYQDRTCVRPHEILIALGLPATRLAHRLCRTRIEWNTQIAAPHWASGDGKE